MESPKTVGRVGLICVTAFVTLGIGLGSSSRLTYHEAFVVQAARELAQSDSWLIPTIDGRPWLEKPPLPFWLVKISGNLFHRFDETTARLPSLLFTIVLILGIAQFSARHYGPKLGLFTGLILTTTHWTITRGRLAEADILLAAIMTWSMVLLDRLRGNNTNIRLLVRLGFYLLFGLTFLVKGLGFGAILIGSIAGALILVDRDRVLLKRLLWAPGLLIAAIIALPWPIAVLIMFPEAWELWKLHIFDRLANNPKYFAGGSPWWFYLPVILKHALPWTPITILGASKSIRDAYQERLHPDRLLWLWSFVPVILLSCATVKNQHYVIHALPPLSIWGAMGLAAIQNRLESRGRYFSLTRQVIAFTAIGTTFGLTYLLIFPFFDERGTEWAFYEKIREHLKESEPLTLLYDDWDRDPYPSPFGPIPHDLAVRLFYLNRPTKWCRGVDHLQFNKQPFAVVARERDRAELMKLGEVRTLMSGPETRWDRTYELYLVTPDAIEITRRTNDVYDDKTRTDTR